MTAGGGSTLTLPTLIFLGLESSVANGTNRIAILIQNISAAYSFKREKYQDLKASLLLSSFTLPGAIAGAILAVKLDDEIFQKIPPSPPFPPFFRAFPKNRTARGYAKGGVSAKRWCARGVRNCMKRIGFWCGTPFSTFSTSTNYVCVSIMS